MLVIQLAPAQALRVCLITRVFKAISMQALNIEAYLTLISFKLNKIADQIVAHLCFRPLYHMLIQR